MDRRSFQTRVRDMIRRNQTGELEKMLHISDNPEEIRHIVWALYKSSGGDTFGYHLQRSITNQIRLYRFTDDAVQENVIKIAPAPDKVGPGQIYDLACQLLRELYFEIEEGSLPDHDNLRELITETVNGYIDLKNGASTSEFRSTRRRLRRFCKSFNTRTSHLRKHFPHYVYVLLSNAEKMLLPENKRRAPFGLYASLIQRPAAGTDYGKNVKPMIFAYLLGQYDQLSSKELEKI